MQTIKENKVNLNILKVFLFVFAFIFTLCFSNTTIYAHKTSTLVTMVDTYTMTLQVTNVVDTDGFLGDESGHLEYKLGDMHSMSIPSKLEPVKDASKGMKFAWPYKGFQIKDGGSIEPLPFGIGDSIGNSLDSAKDAVTGLITGAQTVTVVNDVTGAEIERSILVGTTVVNGLNEAMGIVYKNEEKPSSVDALFSRLNALASGGTINDYSISFNSTPDEMGICYAEINNNKTGEYYMFPYSMSKGYADGHLPDDTFSSEYSGDVNELQWKDFIFQAEYIYKLRGVTMSNSYDLIEVGPVEQFVATMMSNIVYGIQSALNLYSTEDLVFSQGVRGSKAWMYGIMPTSYFSTILKLHMMFLSIAFSILVLAFVRILILENISTMNPVQRQGVLVSIQNIVLTFFLLTLTFPIVSIVMQMASLFTKFFSTFCPSGFLEGNMGQSGLLATIIIMIIYLFINIYLNVIYIVRAIMVSMLLITAPLFVVTIAFGGQWKMYFSFWYKELLSNILLQPVHAMAMGSLALMAGNARGIERIVFVASLMFVTDFYRNILLQGGAGATMMGGKDAMNKGMALGGKMLDTSRNIGRSASGQERDNERKDRENERTSNRSNPTSMQGSDVSASSSNQYGGDAMKNAGQGKTTSTTTTSASSSTNNISNPTSSDDIPIGAGVLDDTTTTSGTSTDIENNTSVAGDSLKGIKETVGKVKGGFENVANSKPVKTAGKVINTTKQALNSKPAKAMGHTAGMVKNVASSVYGAGKIMVGAGATLSGVDGGVGAKLMDSGAETIGKNATNFVHNAKGVGSNTAGMFKDSLPKNMNEGAISNGGTSFVDNPTLNGEEIQTPEPQEEVPTSISDEANYTTYQDVLENENPNNTVMVDDKNDNYFGLYKVDRDNGTEIYDRKALSDEKGIEDIYMNTDTRDNSYASVVFNKQNMTEEDRNTLSGLQQMSTKELNGMGIHSINRVNNNNNDLIKVNYNPKGTSDAGLSSAKVDKKTITITPTKGIDGINFLSDQMSTNVREKQEQRQRELERQQRQQEREQRNNNNNQ